MTTLPYDFMSFMDPTVQRYLADVVRCGNYGEMFRILRALLPDQALANYVYSYSDSLSGLPNYRAFLRDVYRYMKLEKPLVVVSGDVVGLKYANENFGHGSGDNCIRLGLHVLHRAIFDLHPLGGSYREYGDDIIGLGVISGGTRHTVCERVRDYCRAINHVRGNELLIMDDENDVGLELIQRVEALLSVMPIDKGLPFWLSVGAGYYQLGDYSTGDRSLFNVIDEARKASKAEKRFLYHHFPFLNARKNGSNGE